jgi:hypothetical protein
MFVWDSAAKRGQVVEIAAAAISIMQGANVSPAILEQYNEIIPEISLGVEEMGDFFKVALRLMKPATPPAPPPVKRLLLICETDTGRDEMQRLLGIKNKKHFLDVYLRPALKSGLLEIP